MMSEKQLKSNFNYQFLYSQAAQQTIRAVAEFFQSYRQLFYQYLAGELSKQTSTSEIWKKGRIRSYNLS